MGYVQYGDDVGFRALMYGLEGFRVCGLGRVYTDYIGVREIAPVMENEIENNMDNEMKADVCRANKDL